jgi:hypothetical protein
MAKLFNRAKMTTATTGSGTVTLGSASNGFQTFAAAGVSNGDVVQYVIEEGANFEIGTGTYSSSGTSLTRSPTESSNSNNAITLAGQATVSITAVAADLNRLQHGGSDKVTVSSTGASITGNLAVSGTVDGRNVASDGSKLDGIEANAKNDQTITAGGGLAGGGTGDVTLSHSDTSSQASVNNSGGTVIQDVTVDTYGHVTGLTSYNLDGRYYTETEADSRFVNVAGDTMTGHLGIGGTATDANWSDATYGNTEVSIDGGGGYGVLHFRGDGAGSSETRYSVGVGDGIFYMAYDDNDGVHRVKVNTSHQLIVNETSGGSGEKRVFHDGYHPNADAWTTSRTLSLSGDASGSVSWSGSANATLSVAVSNDSHTHDGRYYTESESDTRFLRGNASDTMTGNLTVDNGTSTTLSVKCNDGGNALVRANGDSQGTGALEVGQSDAYGGGISYNGDNSPAFVSGESSDNITFYRMDGGTRTEVFHYPYNGNTVNFNGSITLGGTVDGRDVAADGTKLDTIATNANNYSFPYTVSASASNSTVVQRHSSGYIFANYFNTTPNTVTSGVTQICVETGNDGYIRHGTAAAVRSFIGFASEGSYIRSDADDNVSGHTEWQDNKNVRLGNGADFRMWFDGSHTYFRNYAHAGGNIYFQGEDTEGSNHALLYMHNDGSNPYLRLFQNGGERLRTLSGGVGVTGLCVGDVDANPHNAGGLQVVSAADEKIVLSGTTDPYIRFQEGTTDRAYIGWVSGQDALVFRNQQTDNFDFLPDASTGAVNLRLRGTDNDTWGSLYGTDNSNTNQIGLLDGDQNWAYRITNDTSHEWLINNVVEMSLSTSTLDMKGNTITEVEDIGLRDRIYHDGDTDTYIQFGTNTAAVVVGGHTEIFANTTGVRLGDTGNGYFQPVSGNYGSIQIDGGSHGGWEGYSIGGRAVFMHNNGTATGIYNDVENEWLFYGIHNSYTRMYHNGVSKVETSASGVTVNGDLNSTSDIRYKKNIETIEGAVDKVTALRGVTFDWDNDAFSENETNKKPNFTERATGVIAQDVEKVLPEAVRQNPETGFKNVAYGNMVGLLIEAIKEQQTQIDDLKAEIQSMKS